MNEMKILYDTIDNGSIFCYTRCCNDEKMLVIAKNNVAWPLRTCVNTNTNMQRMMHGLDTPKVSQFSLVYYYLFAGILLVVSVFLFLPRMSSG